MGFCYCKFRENCGKLYGSETLTQCCLLDHQYFKSHKSLCVFCIFSLCCTLVTDKNSSFARLEPKACKNIILDAAQLLDNYPYFHLLLTKAANHLDFYSMRVSIAQLPAQPHMLLCLRTFTQMQKNPLYSALTQCHLSGRKAI